MVATDLLGRGIDIPKINVVINYDLPRLEFIESYMHRVGRAARFNTKGLALSFVSDADDTKFITELNKRFVFQIENRPAVINCDFYSKRFLFSKN
jgi:ATP-dependent RNA helicase UAP56/SUB2